MKPLYLEIEGVKSISEMQSVNFERVSKSGIFGIFGKTGSGKTTILDSIVLAIYGDTTVSIDNKDFVNSGCNKARVMLVFSILTQGERTVYKVERTYKFDKKRVNLTSNAVLYKVVDGVEFPLAENTVQVNNKLEKEIIGLDKKDFLKCIALPQGAFSDFIKQKRSERLTFVGKLFGLEKYGKPLADKIKREDNALKEKENLARGEISALEEYNDEYLKKCKQELEECEQTLEKELVSFNQEKLKFEKLKEDYNLILQREEKIQQKTQKLAYKPVIDGYIKEIELYDSAIFAKKEIEIYQSSSESINKLKNEIDQFDKKQVTLTERKTKAYNEYAKLPQYQEDLFLLRNKFSQVESIEVKLGNLDKKTKKLNETREEYKKLCLQKQSLLAELENCKNGLIENTKLLEKYDAQLAISNLSKGLSSFAIGDLLKRELDFLHDLNRLLEKEDLANKVAVNRLIEGEIEYLSSLKLDKTDENFEEQLKKCKEILDLNRKYLGEEVSLKEKIKSLNDKIVEVDGRINEKLLAGTELKEEREILQTEVNGFLNGKSFKDAVNDIKLGIERLEKRISGISEEFEKVNNEINESALKLAEYKANLKSAQDTFTQAGYDLENKLLVKGITLEAALEVLAQSDRIEKNRATKDSFLNELSAIEIAVGELNEKLKEVTITKEDFDLACRIYTEKEENINLFNKNLGKIKQNYEIGLKKNQQWCIINRNLAEILQERTVLSKVFELVKESRFMEFIAEVYLKEIAKEAENRVLSLTSGRYGLVYQRGNFFVTDNLNGGKERPVLSLSGGETFLVSLSLALALSSQISRRASRALEFFFLDEGFGTLDDDLIDAVTTSLEKLQRSNLTVGLITHVAELKNRITSIVEVTGATALHGTIISDNG